MPSPQRYTTRKGYFNRDGELKIKALDGTYWFPTNFCGVCYVRRVTGLVQQFSGMSLVEELEYRIGNSHYDRFRLYCHQESLFESHAPSP